MGQKEGKKGREGEEKAPANCNLEIVTGPGRVRSAEQKGYHANAGDPETKEKMEMKRKERGRNRLK